MEKNIILAIVLSVIILVVWTFMFRPQITPQKEVEKPSPTQEEPVPPPKIPPLPEVAEELVLENDYLKVTFLSRGAKIKSWYLKRSKKEVIAHEGFGLGLNLFLPGGMEIDLNTQDFQYTWDETTKKAVFEWQNPERGFKIVKTFELSREGEYGLCSIETEDLPLGSEYHLTWSKGIGTKGNNIEQFAFFKGELQEEFKQGTSPDYGRGIKWMGLRQKKGPIVILASLNQPLGGMFKDNYWGFRDERRQSRWIVYAGPQKVFIVRLANQAIKKLTGQDYQLSSAAKVGTWGRLSVGLGNILLFFYSFTHSYGLAIVLLTLLIYGVLSPLTFKQFESMQRMQVVQPELKAIQKKFKSDPKRLQIEMMKVYKKHKINPMAGCLPMVVQLPIIFILYRVLLDFRFTENPSFLWIKDLGKPDIPLLLVLGGTMFLQQKVSQKAQSAAQQEGLAKMMQFFPIFIIVMLWSLPSGVMLYWFTSSLISMVQQFFITRRRVVPGPVKTRK
ncbi:MAG: membrane protein insertase YidC [bacterium]